MTADINTLELHEPDPIEGEVEHGGGGGFVLPPGGRVYTGVAPELPTEGKTQKGYLQFELTPIKLIEPTTPYDGFEVRFTRINVQKWPNRNSNGVLDYLAATGVDMVPRTNEDYRAAVRAATGRPFPFWATWEGRCKQCGWRIKGMDKFPANGDGTFKSRVPCPTCSTPAKEVIVFANLNVGSFGGGRK